MRMKCLLISQHYNDCSIYTNPKTNSSSLNKKFSNKGNFKIKQMILKEISKVLYQCDKHHQSSRSSRNLMKFNLANSMNIDKKSATAAESY